MSSKSKGEPLQLSYVYEYVCTHTHTYSPISPLRNLHGKKLRRPIWVRSTKKPARALSSHLQITYRPPSAMKISGGGLRSKTAENPLKSRAARAQGWSQSTSLHFTSLPICTRIACDTKCLRVRVFGCAMDKFNQLSKWRY